MFVCGDGGGYLGGSILTDAFFTAAGRLAAGLLTAASWRLQPLGVLTHVLAQLVELLRSQLVELFRVDFF